MTELNCSLRSRQIVLEADGVVVAHRRKTCLLTPSQCGGRAIPDARS